MKKDIKFVAIDFETGTPKRDSATSVAIVTFLNGDIIDEYDHLIRPPNNEHRKFNIDLTGITPKKTFNAPRFKELFPEIKKRMDGNVIVAHNAPFDLSVMKACMKTSKLPLGLLNVPVKWICTQRIYKKHYKGHKSYSLGKLAPIYDIELDHHQAISDARACGWLYHKYLKENGIYDKV